MPPRISDYGWEDWLRLRPLSHALKTRRYRAVDRAYGALPAARGDLPAIVPLLRGRRVLVTVAFTDPQIIDWQAQLIRKFVDDVLYIVADNTPDDARAAEIEAVAALNDVPYVRLPRNPWPQPSRSHGLALNWIWRNLIRPGAPSVFGLLDDDMFPTAPTDPFDALKSQDFYGVIRPEGPAGRNAAGTRSGVKRWFLWAGFAMYRFEGVRSKPLDFSQDWFLRLDTGGANWQVLYEHVKLSEIRVQDTSFVPYRDGLDVEEAPFQYCGTWVHEVGVMGKPEHAAGKREALRTILAPHLDRLALPWR